jgi:multiple sugar transport system substrate-binding protein
MKFKIKRNWIGALLLSIAIACLTIATHAWLTTAQKAVTIKLSGWRASPVEQLLLTKVLANFNAKYPNIHIKYEVINNPYMETIRKQLDSKENAPDVFYLDAVAAPLLMGENVLESLNEYIKSEFDINDFEPKLIDFFKSKEHEHIYGLPKDYSTLALFYDQLAFQDAGLERPPANWKELRDYSKKLTIKNNAGEIQRYGFGENIELTRQAYKMKKIVNKGCVNFPKLKEDLSGLEAVVSQYRQEHASTLGSSGSEMLGQKKVAMTIEGNWAIRDLQEKYPRLDFATAEVPSINNKKGTMVFTVAYAMNNKSQHKNEAWKLISYLTGKEGMEKWARDGLALPARKSVASKLELKKDPLWSPFVAGVAYATSWQLGQYPDIIINNFNKQFQSVMSGEQPLAQAMDKAEKDANQQINKISKSSCPK